MSSAIRRLPRGEPSTSSQFPFFDTANGQDRRCSGAELAEMLQGLLSAPSGFITQYAAPAANAFTVQVSPPTNGASIFLLLMPTSNFASGTVALPPVAQCLDHQQVLVSSTAAVGTLAVNGNGAPVMGAPTSLLAGSSFCLQFDAVTQGWYIVSGSGSVSGGGGGGGAVSSVNGQTGDVTIDKAGIGLPAVDNLSFLAMMAAAATMTNKGIDGSTNTFSNIPQSAVTGLVSALGGLVPTSRTITINGTTLDLAADRSWTISLGGLTDGDKGDITVSGTGTVWSIDAAAVTLGKMANLAANSVIANITGSAATPVAVPISSFKSALNISVADVAGSVIAVSANRNMVAADNGATLTFSGAYTLTIPSGLTGINVIVFPPSSGNASIAAGAGVTINGGTSTITRSGANPFSILATGTNTYIVTDNTTGAVTASSTDTLTNKTMDGGSNTFTNIAQSSVSGLTAALAAAGSVVPLGQVYNQTKTDANTTESTLWTLSIPANTIGAKDMLVVESYWENPNSATTKTFRAKIGGNTFHTDQDTTNTALMLRSTLTSMNATNSQRGQISWTAGGFNGTNNGAVLTQDMTTTQSLTLTAQWGTAGSGSNSITLVHARAYVIRGA